MIPAIWKAGLKLSNLRPEDRIKLMNEVVLLLSSGMEPQKVLQELSQIGSSTLGDLCAIFVLDQGTRLLKLAAVHHDDPALVARCKRISESTQCRIGIGAGGRAVETGKTIIWHVSDGGPDPADRAYTEATKAKAMIASPIKCGSRPVGAFTSWVVTADHPFTQDDVMLADYLAAVAGAAVQNVRLWDELNRRDEWRSSLVSKLMAAQEEERAKLARQLHDDASQILSTVLLELTRLEQASLEEVKDRMKTLRIETDNALNRVHDMATELRPPAIDDLGLAGALRRYVNECMSNSDVKIDFVAAHIGPHELSRDAQVSVYRIAQEAILNVVRHSGAQCAGVVLERRKGWLVMTIEDDGHGFDRKKYTSGSPKRSLGLFGMRERASLLGGSVDINSSPGTGTTVQVRIPLQDGRQS